MVKSVIIIVDLVFVCIINAAEGFFSFALLFDGREYVSAALYEYKSVFMCILVFAFYFLAPGLVQLNAHFPAKDRRAKPAGADGCRMEGLQTVQFNLLLITIWLTWQ